MFSYIFLEGILCTHLHNCFVNIIISIGIRENFMGSNCHALIMSPCNVAFTALPIPQPGQIIPVAFFSKQGGV